MVEDIISTLPDALLCHILSFLETKQANSTTILSKRWNNLWLSVPSLYFNNKTRRGADFRFNDYLYSVLLSRDPTLPIKTFRLKLLYDFPEPHCPSNSIAIWINFVVPRGVEYLRLYVERVGLPKLPISILTCKTLVVLKLFGFYMYEGFSSVILPSLKTLHLERIRFFELRDFISFLKGCPILENLLTYDVPFDREESLISEEWKSFCLSNLTQADIDCTGSYFPLKAVHNVSSLSLEFDQDRCCNDFLPTFHNLTQLELISLNFSWKFLVEVLNHCPKLQKLDLDPIDVQSETWTREDNKEKWVDPDVVPQCLSLHLRTCNLFNFLGLQGELMLARYILKNAKVLQTMKIWNDGQPKIETKLYSVPWASSTCELIIYYDDS